jgi:TolB-like protein/DNA-binding SARP family transcriptional activator
VFTLRLLGTASIESTQGPLTGRAAHGRRLALLALLALARGRVVSRDKLVAVLWPEASPERARPQLSDTLYILRSALGEEAVRPMGDGLALSPDVVGSDVVQFERLLEEGLLEEAVGLYAGPLLDGFHIAESVEFESWRDGERARLERAVAEALEKLAAAAEADAAPAAALRWWRQRAALDPCNGRVARRLMQALDAAGDRAGALQHARVHAVLLREQLDAPPDAEVAAYAERLRLEPPAPTPSAPTPPAPPPRAHVPAAPTPPAPPARAHVPAAPPPSTPVPASATPLAAAPAAPEPWTPVPATVYSRGPSVELPLQVSAVAGVPVAPRWRRMVRPAFAVLALVLGLIFTIAYGARRNANPAPARSIGVLPFVNMSADPANSYFSDGLSEQIILALSRIEGLRVAARTSSFALRDRDLGMRAIGDTLGVQAVLEGSVLVDGHRLRVIAQLIDARTNYHTWSEQYDVDLRDAFAVQDTLAVAIADALHLRLVGGAPAPASGRAPGFEAYDLYLRGLHLRNGLSADGLRQAVEYFDRVIALEPHFAQALAAKASVIAPQAYFRYAQRDSVVAQLRPLTTRALELDPGMGEAYVALGVLKLFYEWDWTGAETALRRAIALNPNDAHAWHHLANFHAATGSRHEAIAAREKAVQLDPLTARSRIVLSKDLLLVGDYERALEQARRAAQLDPLNPLLLGRGPSLPAGAAEVLLLQGRTDEAVEEYIRIATLRDASRAEQQAMRDAYASAGIAGFWRAWLAMDVRQSGASPDPFRMTATHLIAGDTAQALDWLDRAFDERNPGLIYLQRDPLLSGLRAQPRFQRIARAMKFPDPR